MKTITIIFLILASSVVAQDSAVQLRPITNVVDSPRLKEIRRIHQWHQNRHKRRTTDDAVTDALRWFSATQNEDGSWGDEDERSLATPLVLLAYLGRGETRGSERFGEHVGRAHKWIMSASASNDPERIATVIALAGYTGLHVSSKERHLATAEVTKVGELLDAIVTTNSTPWVDLLTFHLLPQELERPAWLKYTTPFEKKWQDVKPSIVPGNLDSYLALRLAALGKFRNGGDIWQKFNREYAISLLKHQQKSGSFPCEPESDAFSCTALAVHSLEVYYIMQPQFWVPIEPDTADDEDIEINIE